jgi:hypothetical protein
METWRDLADVDVVERCYNAAPVAVHGRERLTAGATDGHAEEERA